MAVLTLFSANTIWCQHYLVPALFFYWQAATVGDGVRVEGIATDRIGADDGAKRHMEGLEFRPAI